MSRELRFKAVNKSGYDLINFTVTHSWNGKTHLLSGTNLPNNAVSDSVEITSGYTQYDWFAVVLNFKDLGYRSTQFYCNSSSYHTACEIKIKKDDCDLRYFKGNDDDTGCNNKSYYEASVKFSNAEKVEGVCGID